MPVANLPFGAFLMGTADKKPKMVNFYALL
jgi:hypothetical protein